MRWKARLLSAWERIRHGYWFLPSVMLLAAFVLSFVFLEIDRALADSELRHMGWFYTGAAQGARDLLSTVAASMIGVAGVVFSITIVALTLASNQFGPRVLKNFMRDVGNQFVLGLFLAVFLYCILILRQVHGEDGNHREFVPQVSLLLAVALAIVGIGVLVFFIHHIAESIQTPHIIAAITHDLHTSIDHLYPKTIGSTHDENAALTAPSQVPERFEEEAAAIEAGRAGYVERIEADQLFEAAHDRDLIVRIERAPGQFVLADDAVIRIWPAHHLDEDVRIRFAHSFTVGLQRSHAQDVEYAVDQLVEIAVLALSPGINNVFTAMMCVDRLAEGLSHFAERAVPAANRFDRDGRLRVVAESISFPKMLGAAFNQIRQNSCRSLSVMLRLLKAFQRIAEHTDELHARTALREHADMVYDQAMAFAVQKLDAESVAQAYRATLIAIAPRTFHSPPTSP